MAEVRITVSGEIKEKLKTKAKLLGITEAEYVRCLIIEDVKHG